MAGRTRRTRILVLLILGVVAFVLYTRNTAPVDDYRQYFKDKANSIGGGAVVRPKPEEDPYQPPKAPEPEAERVQGPPPVPRPEPPTPAKPETTSSTTTVQHAAASSVTDKVDSDLAPPALAPAPPAPAPASAAPIEDEDLSYELGEGRVEVPIAPNNPKTTALHWSKMPEHFPPSSTIQLPTGTSVPIPRIQRAVKKLADAGADKERLAIVKGVTVHAWEGYKEFAFGFDEIKPISGRVNNPFNGWGATLVDSLDTLWIAGMEKEFEEAVEVVGKIDFTTSLRADIPIFETTIRYLGGLIAAYDVSGKKHIALLDKAVELAEVLYSIFDTPNRMPQTYFRWKPAFASQPHRASNRVVLAEIGTLSLEFTRLAQLTKEPKYYDAIARITDAFEEWQNSTRIPGMWPTSFDASGCNKTATRIQEDQMVAVGDDGMYMTTKTPVQSDNGAKLDKDPYDLKAGLQKSLDEQVAAHQPGVGKIQSWRDEDNLDEKDVKGRLRSEDLGSSKRRRDLDGNESSASEKRAITELDECVSQGLWSTSGSSQETFTLSGASDSMYEYLPKEYLILGGLLEQYRSMYLASAETAIEKLLYKPMTIDNRDILMTGEIRSSPNYSQPLDERGFMEKFKPEAAHLACFAGGMFAMGGVIFNKPEHVEIGSKLTDGCVWAYNVTATGIMPEGAELMQCEDTWGDCAWNETEYWEVLDPYWKSRMQTQAPTQVVEDVEDPASAEKDDATADTDFGPQRPQPSLSKRDSMQGQQPANIERRQLDEDMVDIIRNAPPAPQAPQAPQPFSAPNKPSADDIDPYKPRVQGGIGSIPDPPTYTPEPPLPHEAFVKAKIAEERLPPGYTRINHRSYILRPEAIESVFYMYRITGDQYWRDVGWNMFTSIDSHTRALHGNSALDDVTKQAPQLLDQEESFWLAETLKYFYLLYDEPRGRKESFWRGGLAELEVQEAWLFGASG
ncbi:hypothetical protein LTR09_003096 [Extremus antarcticus]|uniref:alpha-1,2-Mannosidase n=1 Tax=Extremus antarcticus TaxID=702011 RepID=A0AAJ0GEB5_9PEZI|nr:hypothetical protein LTR09_003096 [Extremus antarcticus]